MDKLLKISIELKYEVREALLNAHNIKQDFCNNLYDNRTPLYRIIKVLENEPYYKVLYELIKNISYEDLYLCIDINDKSIENISCIDLITNEVNTDNQYLLFDIDGTFNYNKLLERRA